MKHAFVSILFACPAVLFSQVVAGAGYPAPASVAVAPGQIVTLYAAGLGKATTQVSLQQGGQTVAVPVIETRQVSTCPSAPQTTSCGALLAVTVQIPYEITVGCPLCLRPISATPGTITISDGTARAAIEFNPLSDQVHVLTACDLFLTAMQPVPPPVSTGLPCQPYVTHADGTLVSASAPAKVGETVVAWALGLGATNPAAKTGQPAAQPAPTTETFSIRYDYAVNALATKPYSVTLPLPKPIYTGLAPGFPGLYQINFAIPPEPVNGTSRCVAAGALAQGGNLPQSNLTVSIGGSTSFDGAGICVDTRIPVD